MAQTVWEGTTWLIPQPRSSLTVATIAAGALVGSLGQVNTGVQRQKVSALRTGSIDLHGARLDGP